MSMVLGAYTLPWHPDKFTPPRAKVSYGKTETLESAVLFSFGAILPGTEILMEWEWMPAAQFDALDALYQDDADILWDPETGTSYYVHILDLSGEYLNGPGGAYRGNVTMTLMIVSED